jgi:hypothetical protein
MAFEHGKNTHFTANSVDLSAFLDDASMPSEIDASETTTFGAESKTYLPGLADGSFSISGKLDAAVETAYIAAKGLVVPFIYGPAGSTAGKPRRTGDCILTSYEVSSPVGDIVTFSIEGQITGGITFDTFS